MNGLKLVLDVDGVVIRGRPSDGLPWYATLRQDLGLDPGVLTERFFNTNFQAALRGKADMRRLLDELFASIGARVSVDTFVDYWFRHDAGLNHGLIDFTQGLRERSGLQCYLATNQEQYRTRYIWETLGLELDQRFDGIVSSSNVGACKPEPEFFKSAQQLLELREDDHILFVDDRDAFVLAAQQHGWEAELFRNNEDLIVTIENWIETHCSGI